MFQYAAGGPRVGEPRNGEPAETVRQAGERPPQNRER